MGTAVQPLNPLYISLRRVAALVGAEKLSVALSAISSWNDKRMDFLQLVRGAELLRDWLEIASSEIQPLHVELLRGVLQPGRIFSYEGHLSLRNARGAKPREASIARVVLPQLSGALSDVTLHLQLHPDHVVPGSTGDLLKGQVANLFVLAEATSVENETVEAVPIFVGHFREQGPMALPLLVTRNQVFVDDIDNFAKVTNIRAPSKADLEVLRNLSEKDVKAAFASIVGEPFVPRDWGGERSDLYTTQVRLRGRRVAAAFAFKGPAAGTKFREMRIADLGKNGDQVERLSTEPADLLVIQHCHSIGAAVANTVRAFCNQIGRERLYCLIPGQDTYRVLRAYKKCGL